MLEWLKKRVVINYVGGDKDGSRFDSAIPADKEEVEKALWLTEDGTVGKAYFGGSEAYKTWRRDHGIEEVKDSGFKPHVYKVTDRKETDTELQLTLTFSGHDPKNP